MSRLQENRGIRSQTGLAYVAILLLLTVLSTMGFAFLFKVGIETAATETRGKSMQVDYLAESAANHALWRLLNEPGFNPAADTYYMHSLGNGRYGYKIRKPTETTFATVATVGAIGDSVANQSYVQYIIPSNVFTVYGSSSNAFPFYRRLIGANWTDPADVNIGGASTYWAELEGCPTRKEVIGAFIDSANAIKVTVYDGTAWGGAVPFGQGDMNYKCFDIAYESQSGDALVVARDGTGTPLYYNIWDGSAWAFANPQVAFSLPGGDVRDVVMASQPGGNEILIAVVTSSGQIEVVRWDGSAFHDLGTIATKAARCDFRVVEIVYEHQSGDAMVVWSITGDSALKFRMWNGAALGPEGSLPDFLGNTNFMICGAADSDPTSDYIVIAAIDNFYDINVAVWDGDAWIDSREIEISNSTHLAQSLDIAWEAAGEDAVIAWAPWTATNVRFMAWKKGTALADCTIQEGPDLQNQGWLVRLLPIAGTEKIVLLGQNNLSDLRYCLWTGDGCKGDPTILLEADMPVQNDVAFDLAEANVPRTGGIGSAAGGANQAPVVDAGPDQTVFPTNAAILDGTVTDDGYPNPPATVTTTWSKTSGPGTVTFGDDTAVDTTASFSLEGTYVLRLTADDGELAPFDEVTITVTTVTGCSEDLLFVVSNASSLTSEETERQTLMEGWGWTVTLIDDSDTQDDFDAAAAANDVAYISQEAVAATLGSKLNDTTIGVVNENKDMIDDFGFATGLSMGGGLPTLNIDLDHYITSAFETDTVEPYAANDWYQIADEPVATGVNPVGTWVESPWTGKPALMALDRGAQLVGGGTAAGRRVQIPWGSGQGATAVQVSSLSDYARGLMKRSIEWASQLELGCGGCNGIVGYWKLDETTGLSAADSSGQGNMGSLVNMYPASDWVGGHLVGGLDFDGYNDYVQVPHDDSLSLSSFSIAAWLRPSALSGMQIVACKGTSTTAVNYYLATNNDELALGFYNGGWVGFETTNANLLTNQWYHVAGTFDGATGTAKIYLDSAPVLNDTTAVTLATNSDDLTIGRSPFGSYWPGILDEVRIYDRALDPNEIAVLHALTEGSDCDSLGFVPPCIASDDFETGDYTGSTGNLAWTSNWIEVNEFDGPSLNDEQVLSQGGSLAVRVQDNDYGGEGVKRQVDLSGHTSATLRFKYWRHHLDVASDYVTVEVSGNGGSSWTELDRFAGPATDLAWTSVSYDISSYIAANTMIRFISAPDLGFRDEVFFDNVKIEASGGAPCP